MSVTIGRFSHSEDCYDLALDGDQLSFSIDIYSATQDLNEVKARRQQLVGLQDNVDEPFVPFTWSQDSSHDGWYQVVSVSVPAGQAHLANGWHMGCRVTLLKVLDFGNPALEVIVNPFALRTNSVSVAASSPVVAVALPATVSELDLGGGLAAATAISRVTSSGQTINVYTLAAPVTTQSWYRTVTTPALAYTAGCLLEQSPDSGTTWYARQGRQIVASQPWRISNEFVRLTSAQGATAGTLEVWSGAAWESRSIAHVTNGSVGPGIGLGTGSAQPTVTALRVSPEEVRVKCQTLNMSMIYRITRGNMFVEAAWALSTGATALKLGCGYSTTVATSSLASCGIVTTANDANNNKLVFMVAPTSGGATVDNVNGRVNFATAAASGTMFMGVVLDGSSAISGNAASDLQSQAFSTVSTLQRVVPR